MFQEGQPTTITSVTLILDFFHLFDQINRSLSSDKGLWSPAMCLRLLLPLHTLIVANALNSLGIRRRDVFLLFNSGGRVTSTTFRISVIATIPTARLQRPSKP